jgi:NitT/TauT family transport system ATP-binding protein
MLPLTSLSNTFELPKPADRRFLAGALEVSGLYFSYGAVQIFDNFSWHAGAPIVVLEGPSGCGKTTLLRILAGHLEPTALTSLSVPEDSRLILQEDGLFPWLTTAGNLAIIPGSRCLDELSTDVGKLATLVAPYSDKIVGTLSFGQRRLLELLRVFANPTPLILLDEPLNFLDSTRRLAVIESIAALASKGYQFVISSHYETDFHNLKAKRFRFDGDMPYRTIVEVRL